MDPNLESAAATGTSEGPQASLGASKGEASSLRAHVLIVDDSYMVAEMLSNFLGKQGCSISYALDGLSALEQIRRRTPDLIIADWVMPALDGLELCRQLRQAPEYAWVYYILMTAREGNDNMERALEAGADEFLSKPFQAAELLTRVRAGLRIVESRRQQYLLQTGQKQVSSPSGSVALGNRQDLVTRLPLRVAQARAQSDPLSLFVLRLANLAALGQGLEAGGRAALLKLFTDRLAHNLREGDDLFCYDEGQFIVVLPGSTLAAAQIAAERCCQRLIQDPFVVNGQALPVQLQFGAATLTDKDDPKGVALLRRAAQALRDSKNVHTSVVTAPHPILVSDRVRGTESSELLKSLQRLEQENANLRQELETHLRQLKELRQQNQELSQRVGRLGSETSAAGSRSQRPLWIRRRKPRRRLKRQLGRGKWRLRR
ncbi:PleD family two-component response regulator [Thermostichus sp. MS-CIW-19]